MKQLKATDVLASKKVMLIARSLMKLLETFGDGHKGRFLDYVNSRLGISKSSYYYYMEYYAFMSKYPKFQTLAVSFRVFRTQFHRGGKPSQQVVPRQSMTPSDCSDNDNAINGELTLLLSFTESKVLKMSTAVEKSPSCTLLDIFVIDSTDAFKPISTTLMYLLY
ncbi:hypothetical protein BATDEDRAFT_25789 [Batrachochytrium dendrobatidis JAM81]|uniref:Uncharacterized protein n=2 Tax=Batrachochytrium dendrobatidis TaxID=109871 RepID=F4P5M2_BATDJ|nr:uncharacterized protein BATDEDRAFT_25789 [Batrachochytrium dendrobatidis JAM81]EGF79213.1 hypothetical protein BATDEDRAFT_25789 [Batrachochytrium dendrobatidis JAM81]OAJ42892.1 hypothetical protein, variant 1 [Batrachochytrium dendrobatidis JEL423]OAJ42893.1 hypothetical protein, variant 2 [Batrachochytrium dendrobatidis JEL423]|eukprot:XP_006679886.1 hypothetical protein BATDEDRAFT_25789 [Batrachochytrium dendrobatidis JAM81]